MPWATRCWRPRKRRTPRPARPAWEERRLQFYHPRNDALVPIAFSAAACRFGRSMVRPIYRLNTRLHGGDNPELATPDEINRGLKGRFFIFAGVQSRGLNGFDAFPEQRAIDWSLSFVIDGSGGRGGTGRVQPAYKIDTSLGNPLGFLPEFSATVPPSPPPRPAARAMRSRSGSARWAESSSPKR